MQRGEVWAVEADSVCCDAVLRALGEGIVVSPGLGYRPRTAAPRETKLRASRGSLAASRAL